MKMQTTNTLTGQLAQVILKKQKNKQSPNQLTAKKIGRQFPAHSELWQSIAHFWYFGFSSGLTNEIVHHDINNARDWLSVQIKDLVR